MGVTWVCKLACWKHGVNASMVRHSGGTCGGAAGAGLAGHPTPRSLNCLLAGCRISNLQVLSGRRVAYTGAAKETHKRTSRGPQRSPLHDAGRSWSRARPVRRGLSAGSASRKGVAHTASPPPGARASCRERRQRAEDRRCLATAMLPAAAAAGSSRGRRSSLCLRLCGRPARASTVRSFALM